MQVNELNKWQRLGYVLVMAAPVLIGLFFAVIGIVDGKSWFVFPVIGAAIVGFTIHHLYMWIMKG